MTEQEALFLLNLSIEDIEAEIPLTKAVLESLPEEGVSYRPDPKARSAGELALHIAYYEKWFLDSIIAGTFLPEKEERPEGVTTNVALVSWWEKEVDSALEKLKELSPTQAHQTMEFAGTWKLPAAQFIGWMLKHSIHHRGQLTSYIRPAGGAVPSIYGPSADSEWKM